ncbi:MAG: hypothetical protein HGA19_08035 [Oscillochloris sp.]|nr:hypothetical protein [Oscillochloris sp.]
MLIAFHSGNTVVHLTTWWDQPVDLDFHFLQPANAVAALQQAQFSIEAEITRAPYSQVEHPSQRAYILARKGD